MVEISEYNQQQKDAILMVRQHRGAAAILHGIDNHCIIAFLLKTTIWLRKQLSDEPQV